MLIKIRRLTAYIDLKDDTTGSVVVHKKPMTIRNKHTSVNVSIDVFSNNMYVIIYVSVREEEKREKFS